jgi:hypothetical protein
VQQRYAEVHVCDIALRRSMYVCVCVRYAIMCVCVCVCVDT